MSQAQVHAAALCQPVSPIWASQDLHRSRCVRAPGFEGSRIPRTTLGPGGGFDLPRKSPQPGWLRAGCLRTNSGADLGSSGHTFGELARSSCPPVCDPLLPFTAPGSVLVRRGFNILIWQPSSGGLRLGGYGPETGWYPCERSQRICQKKGHRPHAGGGVEPSTRIDAPSKDICTAAWGTAPAPGL